MISTNPTPEMMKKHSHHHHHHHKKGSPPPSASTTIRLEQVLLGDLHPQEDNNPKPSVKAVYDLGPGGRYRRNTEGGTPVVFEKLKTARDGKLQTRFLAYEEYMNSKVKFRPKPEEAERPVHRTTAPVAISESLYQILQVPVTCSALELKAAFRQLALSNHPDKGGDSLTFDKIKTAYDILSNAKLREVYDEDGFNGVSLMNPEFDPAKFAQT